MKKEIVIQLLDAAKAMTGSDYATAKALHVGNQTVYHWRTGRAKMPAADVVLAAKLAGLDPVDWCARAVIDKHEGTEKGAALSDALKKALAATGEAEDTYSATGQRESYFIRCIKSNVMQLPERRKFRRYRASPHGGGPPYPLRPRLTLIATVDSRTSLLINKRGFETSLHRQRN